MTAGNITCLSCDPVLLYLSLSACLRLSVSANVYLSLCLSTVSVSACLQLSVSANFYLSLCLSLCRLSVSPLSQRLLLFFPVIVSTVFFSIAISQATAWAELPLVGFVTINIAGMACWLERRTRDRKFPSSNPSRSGGRIFFSRINYVC